jgi:hypothetical protein
MEKGFNGGQPITEAWFTDKLSGGHNPEAIAMLFPGINDADNAAIADDKEARFRVLAGAWRLIRSHRALILMCRRSLRQTAGCNV